MFSGISPGFSPSTDFRAPGIFRAPNDCREKFRKSFQCSFFELLRGCPRFLQVRRQSNETIFVPIYDRGRLNK